MRASSHLAALFVGVALLSAPAPTLAAMPVISVPRSLDARAMEVYRLYIVGDDSVASQHVELTLEQGQGGTTGVLQAGSFSSALESVHLEDGVLSAIVTTTHGRGTLEFHPFAERVDTLTEATLVFTFL